MQVRGDIIGAFASSLATNIWGASLSADEKRRVVVEFIDVVEKTPNHAELLPTGGTLARLYRNLGIESRLASAIPQDLPKDCEGLMNLIGKNRDVVEPARLLMVAEAVERDHMERIEKSVLWLRSLADVYLRNKMPQKAIPLLIRAASKDSRCYCDLFDLSLRPDPGVSPEDAKDYLDKFIAGAAADWTPSGPYCRNEAYRRAVACLFSAGRYQDSLRLISRHDADTSLGKQAGATAEILLMKARSLDKLADRGAALGAYLEFKRYAHKYNCHYDSVMPIVEKRIAELSVE